MKFWICWQLVLRGLVISYTHGTHSLLHVHTLRQFPNLFDVAVPLTALFIFHGTPWGKHLFFKIDLFSNYWLRGNTVVYCCWVSIYALINYVILFFFISTSRGTPGYRVTPVGNHYSTDYVVKITRSKTQHFNIPPPTYLHFNWRVSSKSPPWKPCFT
jgi:hypothetical protein